MGARRRGHAPSGFSRQVKSSLPVHPLACMLWLTWKVCRLIVSSHNHLFNIENLVLGAKSEYNGFAGTGESFFGVLQYWSTVVL
jgi:hypothetical protein